MTRPTPTFLPDRAGCSLEEQAEGFRRQVLQPLPAPFFGDDVSAGMENELQVAVEGEPTAVDLSLSLKESGYYTNLMLSAGRGDLPLRRVEALNTFIEENQQNIWENSWVRFPCHLLSGRTAAVLEHDLTADKETGTPTRRGDAETFSFTRQGEPWLRLPLSYLLKLSLIEAVHQPGWDASWLHSTAQRISRHLISDNISPEITSFTLANGTAKTLPGGELADECSRRFFFAHLLLGFAEKTFHLDRNGQRLHLYFAPTPPLRQKHLNALISDQLYCDLLLNPCLSGWARGEEKKAYMGLCHRTLCRSQLNTLAILKEAGIIANNLIVLPNTSTTSLANNGTHITLGSRCLSTSFRENGATAMEKYFGDLVIKITEHFLPLFVGTYTAAPYRIGFSDFHPEKVMGFLPHQLEPTHLLMIWRRWKKKAQLQRCGHAFTPMGPEWIDRLLGEGLRLHGDMVIDNRLIDYLVALRSQESSPALNGRMHNQDLLKKDLFELGVFNPQMPMYLPLRLRDQLSYGFTGLEGRHYSLFPDFQHQLAGAANLQTIITALAWQWVIAGDISHHDIPDTPFVESERRQIFFNTAIGIPTFYVRADTDNRFLRRILARVKNQRTSRRYKGFIRIELKAYQEACLAFLHHQSTGITNQTGFTETLHALEAVISGRQPSAYAKLSRNILVSSGRQGPALKMQAEEFNRLAESYYRTELCAAHLHEGLASFTAYSRQLANCNNRESNHLIACLTGNTPPTEYIAREGRKFLQGRASITTIHRLLLLFLLVAHTETATG